MQRLAQVAHVLDHFRIFVAQPSVKIPQVVTDLAGKQRGQFILKRAQASNLLAQIAHFGAGLGEAVTERI